jgi:hypothetical protein
MAATKTKEVQQDLNDMCDLHGSKELGANSGASGSERLRVCEAHTRHVCNWRLLATMRPRPALRRPSSEKRPETLGEAGEESIDRLLTLRLVQQRRVSSIRHGQLLQIWLFAAHAFEHLRRQQV